MEIPIGDEFATIRNYFWTFVAKMKSNFFRKETQLIWNLDGYLDVFVP